QGIEDAFRHNLDEVQWMDPAARAASLEKLKKINNKIAYPEKWRDYSSLQIGKESLLANLAEAARFETKRDLDKIGKPVDRAEWGMSPPTVNAYYNPSLNEMVFPAGILQPPFFDSTADDAVNYGAIGAVIGHEITHGFDDQGSRSDAEGNLRNWWTADDRARFNAKAEKLVQQYNDCVAVGTAHVNGRLTLGENL